MAKFRAKPAQKAFYQIFDQLCRTRQAWEAWADFVTMFATAISNTVDRQQAPSREERYLQIINRYPPEEQRLFPQLAEATVDALESNQEQDFLGGLYMGLGLGSHWHGQFFTPYSLCVLMAQTTLDDAGGHIAAEGWTSCADPACGAGATLIAAANELRRQGINYHHHVLFVGVAAMMCYIQVSLVGCPGYIVVGNSLTTPVTGHPLFPIQQKGLDIWYTPLFFISTWHWRRVAVQMKEFLK